MKAIVLNLCLVDFLEESSSTVAEFAFPRMN